MEGIVDRVVSDRGFGFIVSPGEHRSIFFHCKDVDRGLAFDETLHGQRVTFDLVETPKGLSGKNVRAAV